MSAFHYVAIDSAGKTHQGVLEGDSERQIRENVRALGLFPMEIRMAAASKKEKFSLFSIFKRKTLSVSALALITRQLATLISAGLPIESALKIIADQAEVHYEKSVLLSIRQSVCEGKTLSDSLRVHSGIFSDVYCAQVAAGETSGHLNTVLERLADFMESRKALRQKIQTALVYPALMCVVSIGLLSFLLTYVVPKMVDLFDTLDSALPFVTVVLLSLSSAIKHYGLYGVAVLIIAGWCWHKAMKARGQFRRVVHRVLLRAPLIGQSIKAINTTRFLKTFSVMVGAGIPVLEAMNASLALVMNISLQEAIASARDHVRTGASIYLALKQTGYFSPMSIHLIASGEATGELGPMLSHAALIQEKDIVRRIDVLLALFEPMMILVMGSLVLFIVLAIMLPIFSMNDLVN